MSIQPRTVDTLASTRDRLIYSALRLFADKGYGSTSIADILHLADARSGSFYHFFPTKQDLLLAVLAAYRDGIGVMLLDPSWRGVEDPIERVFALLARYRELLVESDCMYGCPIGSLALELHEPDPPVRELLSANFDAWITAIEQCFLHAADRLPATDPRQLAILALTTMEGGVMLSRTFRTLDPYDAAVSGYRSHVDRLLEVAGQ